MTIFLSSIQLNWLENFGRLMLTLIVLWFLVDQSEVFFGIDIWILLWISISMAFFMGYVISEFIGYDCWKGKKKHAACSGAKDLSSEKDKTLETMNGYFLDLEGLMTKDEIFKTLTWTGAWWQRKLV